MNDRSRHAVVAKPNNPVAVPSRTPNCEPLGSRYREAINVLVGRLAFTRPLAVLDLETTGVSVERDRIVQVGIVRIEPTGGYCEFDRLVNPEMPIPAAATAVHGITNEMVADEFPFTILAPDVSQFLSGCDVAGYNVKRFDQKLLQAEYRRVGIPCPLKEAKVVDPFLIFIQREARTLAGAVRFYCGLPDFEGHRALDDVRATLCVLAGQLAKYPDLPGTIDALHQLCEQRDPSWIDPDGKIAFKCGEACVTFGKNAGRSLRDLATRDPDYLRWIIAKDFSADVKAIVHGALRGRFPVDIGNPMTASRGAAPKDATQGPLAGWRLTKEAPSPPQADDPNVFNGDTQRVADGPDVSWPQVQEPEWPEVEEASWPGPEDADWPEGAETRSLDVEDPTGVQAEPLRP